MTYKKAIKIIVQCLKLHGFELTKGAQQQAGYLALFATEGEVSKQLHHDLKNILQNLKCVLSMTHMSEKVFCERLEKYGELLESENPEGGEVDIGWLIKEAKGVELWEVFAGH